MIRPLGRLWATQSFAPRLTHVQRQTGGAESWTLPSYARSGEFHSPRRFNRQVKRGPRDQGARLREKRPRILSDAPLRRAAPAPAGISAPLPREHRLRTRRPRPAGPDTSPNKHKHGRLSKATRPIVKKRASSAQKVRTSGQAPETELLVVEKRIRHTKARRAHFSKKKNK